MPLRAKVNDKSAWPSLVPLRRRGGLPPIVLSDASVVVGSELPAQIRLRSPSVSDAHVLILVSPGKAYIRDLASENHLYVNDELVREACLQTGDVIRIGRFAFCVRDARAGSEVESQAEPKPPAMNLRIDDRIWQFCERVVLIGSRMGCDVILPATSAAGVHAALIWVDQKWHIRELGSQIKTFVNSVEVKQQAELTEGDVIRVGTSELCFVDSAAGASANESQPQGETVAATTVIAGAGEMGGREVARVLSFDDLTRRMREEPRGRGLAGHRWLWVGLGVVAGGVVVAVLHACNL